MGLLASRINAYTTGRFDDSYVTPPPPPKVAEGQMVVRDRQPLTAEQAMLYKREIDISGPSWSDFSERYQDDDMGGQIMSEEELYQRQEPSYQPQPIKRVLVREARQVVRRPVQPIREATLQPIRRVPVQRIQEGVPVANSMAGLF